MHEPLPLATIQEAVLDFVRGRGDVAVFGAQAVNAYVDEPRMTQDVDLLSPRASELAEELRAQLATRFRIAVRVRRVGERGFRLYQIRTPKNRHLVDIRPVAQLPPTQDFEGLLVVAPAELVAAKVIAFQRRRNQPKSGTDWRDLAMLLLAFPDLKAKEGPVRDRLRAADADAEVVQAWEEIVDREILPEDEEGEF